MRTELDEQEAVCPFCGSKELIIEDNEVTVERIKSKTARNIKDIEYKEFLEKKELELEKLYYEEKKKIREKERDSKEVKNLLIIYGCIMAITIFLIAIDSFVGGIKGEISFPTSPENYVGEQYHIVEMELEDAGFTNVTLKPLNDLNSDSYSDEGIVYKIMIDGKTDFFQSKEMPDVPIIIYYHSIRE